MPTDDSDHPPTSKDFQKRLDAILDDARRSGQSYMDVQAKTLHKMVGGYSNKGNHRMYACCRVMKKRMQEGDKILSSPPKGHGPSLQIRYLLER